MLTSYSIHISQLVDLDIISMSHVELYSDKTRDNQQQPVYRCQNSGVIFLDPISSPDQTDDSILSYWGTEDRAVFLEQNKYDTTRRLAAIKDLVQDKKYLDIGTGLGGILDAAQTIAKYSAGVEPHKSAREILTREGLKVWPSIVDVSEDEFDLISLFHVFEHLSDPLTMLKEVKKRLAPDGTLIIEVPQANDALLTEYKCEAFKFFTLWTEHLILHTTESLRTMLEACGYSIKKIDFVQRYDLANHMFWLSEGRPGGHQKWSDKFTDNCKAEYEKSLMMNGTTDTIVIYACHN